MKDRKITIIVIVGFLVLIGLLLMLWDRGYSWRHSYSESDDEPYGSDLFYQYLKLTQSEKGIQELDSVLPINLAQLRADSLDYTYVYNGFLPYLDSTDRAEISAFVQEGNDMVLLIPDLPTVLVEIFNDGDCVLYPESHHQYNMDPWSMYGESSSIYKDSMIDISFTHPDYLGQEALRFEHIIKDKLQSFPWRVMDSSYFCPENQSLQALAHLDDEVVFFKVSYGEGYFYIHLAPKLFTNFYLIRTEGRRHADMAFSHFSKKPMVLDRKRGKYRLNQNIPRKRYNREKGPLSYILSQESLRWALYTLLSMTLLFLLFGSRRKQRSIPVLKKKENSSREYADTIASLYYSNDGEDKIFQYLSEQFFSYVRKRYRINMKWGQDELWERLAQSSGIPISYFNQLKELHQKGSYAPNIDEKLLTEYYSKLQYFYTHCK